MSIITRFGNLKECLIGNDNLNIDFKKFGLQIKVLKLLI